MKAIGIDIGTTSVCGVVIDKESGEILKSRTENSNAFLPGCADWEKIQSVDKIIGIAMDILHELIDGDTGVIGVTGQMHGITYTDEEGNSVSPLYIWQDGRGNLEYKGTTYAKYLSSASGYGNVTDFYNRENGIRPEQAVSYCTIHDYFVMKLCSLKRPVIHSSDAASFGCFDIEKNKFSYDCDCTVEPGYRIAGEYRGIPVSVAIGDNQASVFSTLADENDVLVNVGTGSQISIVSDRVVEGADIETRPYFEGKYLVVGAALCGGRAYSMLKNFYSEIVGCVKEVDDEQIYDIMNKMLQKNQSGLTVDTRFAGTRRNTDICGSVTGITENNFTPSALTYGFLQGIASELNDMYIQMNVSKKGIVGSGNGIRKNSALTKIFEKMFMSEMKIPAHMEEAACGAALYGLISAGFFKNAQEAQSLIKYKKGDF